MAELSAELAEAIAAACAQAVEDAGDAFTRAFDQPIQVAPGTVSAWQAVEQAAALEGPGLVLAFQVGETAAVALLSGASGVLPEWYAAPDATGTSKLATLAQELGMLVVPGELVAEKAAARAVEKLDELVAQARWAEDAQVLPLTLTAGEQSATLHLVWPATALEVLLPAPTDASEATDESQESNDRRESPEPPPRADAVPSDEHVFAHLPPYTRSMLRIRVPVMVTLATKKQSIQKIIELGPGSIIKFEKSCDEMLELEVGGRVVAEGEAVKVGDKFGLRISSMVLPGEKFEKLSRLRRTPSE